MKRFRVWAIAAAMCGAVGLLSVAPASRADSNDESEKVWQQIEALHWVHGPNNVPALQNATFQLPGNFIFLDTGESDDFLRLTENIPGVPEQILAPDDLHWWASIDFSDDGYVKDEEKLDGDAILNSIKEGTEQGNEERRRNGWGELHVAGWRTAPHYDTTTKRLEWALDLKDERGQISTNFQTRLLGRRGVTNVTLVTDPEHVDADVAAFKSALAGFRFNPGDTYAEFKTGDKVAAYGLTALIVGGGAAVAAKSGLFKFLGKFIWVGILAVVAAGARLFKRKPG
jgi:uncharacterized membrane-anchored protein